MKNPRQEFNNKILKATYKAQKEYGFKMGTGEHATWNNEADAFKHAYMQAVLTIEMGGSIAKFAGDYHEKETPNTPWNERNMDLWNNAIGREVAQNLQKEFGDTWKYLPQETKLDLITKNIIIKMRAGELITNPSDPRKFENMELERLKPQDKVFYKGEYDTLNELEQEKYLKQYSKQLIDNNWKIQEKSELDKKVKTGGLIYVDNYIKADGTKVSGYYRAYPKK